MARGCVRGREGKKDRPSQSVREGRKDSTRVCERASASQELASEHASGGRDVSRRDALGSAKALCSVCSRNSFLLRTRFVPAPSVSLLRPSPRPRFKLETGVSCKRSCSMCMLASSRAAVNKLITRAMPSIRRFEASVGAGAFHPSSTCGRGCCSPKLTNSKRGPVVREQAKARELGGSAWRRVNLRGRDRRGDSPRDCPSEACPCGQVRAQGRRTIFVGRAERKAWRRRDVG
eukprot:6194141-Pleurochrysis_carterae.AAC.1